MGNRLGLYVIALCMAFSLPALAQVAGGAFSGRVTDPSGAVIPNAKAVVQNTATGVTTKLTTNTAGLYSTPGLNPGTYNIRVSAPGFVTSVRAGLILTVGAQEAINFKLQVGSVQKTVTVTGAAPMVQTTTSSISAVVNEASVQQLPLNGRSWTDLAALQPGVNASHTQQASGNGQLRGTRGYGNEMTISGAIPQRNSYLLDGISINDYSNGAPGSVLGGNLGVNAIREFAVITTNYTAQYGNTSGGVISAVTRSGTNSFHGAAYEFIRNDKLDAANYFEHGVRSPFKRNQFGGDIGGPIIKNKTFFFGDYEGIRQAQGNSTVSFVPSPAARLGNLSTGTVTVNPNVQKYLALYPVPQAATCPEGKDVCPFAFSGQQIANENFFTTRIDNTFSSKDSIFGTFVFDRAPYTAPDAMNNVLNEGFTSRQTVAIQETHAFSPSFINAIRFGFNHENVKSGAPVNAVNPAAADHSLAAFPGEYASVLKVTGLSQMNGGLGASPYTTFDWNNYQFDDDANYFHGKHSIKFGLNFERMLLNREYIRFINGVWQFRGLQNFLTGVPYQFQATVPSTITPRDFRQNLFGAYLQDDWQVRPNLTLNLGLRYEMTTVLNEANGKTVSLRNITDPQPFCGIYVPGACAGEGLMYHNPTLYNFEPRVGFAWDVLGNGKMAVRGGAGIFDIQPLAYQFYGSQISDYPFNVFSTERKGLSFFQAPNPLPLNKLVSAYVQPNPERNYVVQYNLNVQYQITPSLAAMVAYVGSEGIHMLFEASSIDLNIPTTTSAGAGYIWPKVDVLGNLWNPSLGCTQTDSTGTDPSGCVAPTTINPNYSSVYGNFSDGRSYYNALDIGLTKRMSHGLQLQGSFTWQKSIDTGAGGGLSDPFLNSISSLSWWNLGLARGLSDFNVGRTLVVSALWNVPGLKSGPAYWVTNGWELGGILSLSDGMPFTANWGTGGDPQNSLNNDSWSYPDVLRGVPGCGGSLVNPGNPNNYIKTQCFSVPTAPNAAYWNANCDPAPPSLGATVSSTSNLPSLACFNLYGTSGRNTLIGPGIANLDFSIYKNNYIRRISENFNVQFRAEFYNIMNHTDFQLPNPNDGNSDIFDATGKPLPGSAGVLVSTSVPQREIQFALQVIF